MHLVFFHLFPGSPRARRCINLFRVIQQKWPEQKRASLSRGRPSVPVLVHRLCPYIPAYTLICSATKCKSITLMCGLSIRGGPGDPMVQVNELNYPIQEP